MQLILFLPPYLVLTFKHSHSPYCSKSICLDPETVLYFIRQDRPDRSTWDRQPRPLFGRARCLLDDDVDRQELMCLQKALHTFGRQVLHTQEPQTFSRPLLREHGCQRPSAAFCSSRSLLPSPASVTFSPTLTRMWSSTTDPLGSGEEG